jgi:pre-mRNA-splicing helicase BRR2
MPRMIKHALLVAPGRTTKKGYEEVHVPALKPKPFADNEKLVNISELPDWSQSAFAGKCCA